MTDTYLSLEEVAQRLGITTKLAKKYLREGKLKGEKDAASGLWFRVKETDLEAFITGKC